MITITYEYHAATPDTGAGLESGWHDIGLSETGFRQAAEMGKKYSHAGFNAIFHCDLKRSTQTAETAFGKSAIKIFKEPKIRECNYGYLTRHPTEEIEPVRIEYIDHPYPNGESYRDVVKRVGEFLTEMAQEFHGKKFLMIGGVAPAYALEHLLSGVALEDALFFHSKPITGTVYNLEKNYKLYNENQDRQP